MSARPMRPLPSVNGWNALELRVRDRGLSDRLDVVAVRERDQVAQERGNLSGGGGT